MSLASRAMKRLRDLCLNVRRRDRWANSKREAYPIYRYAHCILATSNLRQ